MSPQELDISSPGRMVYSGYPRQVAQVGVDANNYLRVEFYPVPSDVELVQYVYWKQPTDLTLSSTIPQNIDAYVLKEGVLVDAYRAAKIDSAAKGSFEAAALFGNEEQKQRTLWNKYLADAYRTAQAQEDKILILEGFGGYSGFGDDITNGRDYSRMQGYGL
jgi:hypothetical protein